MRAGAARELGSPVHFTTGRSESDTGRAYYPESMGPAFAFLLSAYFAVLAPSQRPSRPVPKESLNNGDHWRIETERGFVHVWRPHGYEASSAGIIVYVHGYYTDVDTAWSKHRLVDQFDASGKNALFVVGEAPVSSDDEVTWPELGDLLRAVTAGTGQSLPRGPLIVIGHSGAYRTVVGWLDYPPVRHIILLDAMYGNEEDYLAWLEESRGHAGRRLTIIANDTTRWAEPFVKRLAYAQTSLKIPETIEELPPLLRDARVLYLRSQIAHMEIVTGGKILPMILQRLKLKNLKPVVADLPAQPAAPGSP